MCTFNSTVTCERILYRAGLLDHGRFQLLVLGIFELRRNKQNLFVLPFESLHMAHGFTSEAVHVVVITGDEHILRQLREMRGTKITQSWHCIIVVIDKSFRNICPTDSHNSQPSCPNDDFRFQN